MCEVFGGPLPVCLLPQGRRQSASRALPLSAVRGHGSPKPHSEDCLAPHPPSPCMNEPVNLRLALALLLLVLWNCLLPVLRNEGATCQCFGSPWSQAFLPAPLIQQLRVMLRASVLGGGRDC